MRRVRDIPGRSGERGIVILLVAVFLLFVVGAMAALAIDVVALYTARSEAQLAADGAALAGARVLANSGMTSDPSLTVAAQALADKIATQVATHNEVGGRLLNFAGGEVTVTFNVTDTTNPRVTVVTRRNDLPTFFARIWGNSALAVTATATAEAYNPSGMDALAKPVTPVAPLCVKPWLLPNLDPTQAAAGPAIFGATGAILNPALVGKTWGDSSGPPLNPNGLFASLPTDSPTPGKYYPGAIDAVDFPVPTKALPTCSAGFSTYQLAVAGCVQRPIACGATATINIDTVVSATRDTDTEQAVSCLIHDNGSPTDVDSIDTAASPTPPPFQFLGGNQNPVVSARGQDVLISDSLATVPVFDTLSAAAPTNPVTVIGFLQVFLGPPDTVKHQVPATIINMVGCGQTIVAPPILGNGASPVTVRLVAGP